MKKIIKILNHESKHWVGDGFHVHGIIRPTPDIYEHTNPFILMDYASPQKFNATPRKLGVGAHPHKGFETVTFAIQGEVEHRDSSGGGGVIKTGGVQWMTAGRGIVHEEFHSRDFAKEGGVFEMVQLWVNLPKKDKLTSPKYQGLNKDKFPVKKLDGSDVKVIAGKFQDLIGAAQTFTQMNIYEIEMDKDKELSFNLDAGTNTAILAIDGEVIIDGKELPMRNIALFSKEGDKIQIQSTKKSRLLLLNAEPIDEPIFAHGPFVMNTREEISQAIEEYNNGDMGHL